MLVDIDSMFQAATDTAPAISHKPRAASLTLVKEAFDAAPVDGVANCPYPDVDDDDGINLFIDPITNDDCIPYDAELEIPAEFKSLEADHFDATLEAYVHCNVWASQFNEKDKAAVTNAGLANFTDDAQDFLITLGAFPNFGGKTEQASDFIHELGHSRPRPRWRRGAQLQAELPERCELRVRARRADRRRRSARSDDRLLALGRVRDRA